MGHLDENLALYTYSANLRLPFSHYIQDIWLGLLYLELLYFQKGVTCHVWLNIIEIIEEKHTDGYETEAGSLNNFLTQFFVVFGSKGKHGTKSTMNGSELLKSLFFKDEIIFSW